MDLPANFHPETGAGSSASTISAPSLSASISTSSTTSSLFDDKELGMLGGGRTPEERFRSLTDLKWGEFEAMGFGDLAADNKKLQFDLTESARAVSIESHCLLGRSVSLTVLTTWATLGSRSKASYSFLARLLSRWILPHR